MSLLTQAGHQVQTSIASLGARQWRLNAWMTKNMLGCGECPCDICSVPEANYTHTLLYDQDGHITEDTLDLSCVPAGDCTNASQCGIRSITINNNRRGCELPTGCDGVSSSEQKKVYLTHCEPSTENTPVRIYLTNNGVAVTQDEFGNKVPEYYLLAEGQVKFLCVVNGSITRIVN